MNEMKKRVLMVATVPSMIGQFNMNNIKLLHDMGYQVDVAADYTDTSVWPKERTQRLKDQLMEMEVECIQLDFSRNPLVFSRHIRSYRETLKLIRDRQYAFIHTHTPIASAIVRLAARKTNTRVIYTAHGFHFYDGAPLKNWIIYYPVEKWLSKYTDVLITINTEDYKRAREKFTATRVEYVPGIGVNTGKFVRSDACREQIRREFGIGPSGILLLSVGELNDNKNHAAVIRALARMKASDELPGDLHYIIVGKGERAQDLTALIEGCGLKGNVILAGFRSDVAAFYSASDVFVFPSFREGLSVSLMEAMSSGLTVACSKIRGNTDLVDEGKGGFFFDPKDDDSIIDAIRKVLKADHREMGLYNIEKVRSFDLDTVNGIMTDLYKGQTAT